MSAMDLEREFFMVFAFEGKQKALEAANTLLWDFSR